MQNINYQEYKNHFSDTGFWNTLKKYSQKIGQETIHKSLCLWLVIKEGDAPLKAKATAVGALGYLISPFDLVPDITPVVGLSDDIAVVAMAFVVLAAYITPEISEKALKMMPQWVRK